MKKDHLVEFDGRGLLHCEQVLAEYLPGFDPGVTALEISKGLLAGATFDALEITYGVAGAANVLRAAGVMSSTPISDAEALSRLATRDLSLLPTRLNSGAARDWHLDAVNVKPAWQLLGGPANINWGSVKVGQIDTGYTQHPVFGFGNQSWVDVSAGRTFFAQGSNGGIAGPGGGQDPLAGSMDGHGTRVGSVICGYDQASEGGAYLGVAPKVPLVPVRIADTVLITHAQRELARGLEYLVNDAKVSVINLSMGFLPRTQIRVLDQAINAAYMAGVIFVCAAGQPLRHVVSPAHGRRTIAVAGTTKESVPWGKSAYGSAVDWSGPAAQIYRANMRKLGNPIYGGGGDGTSYATAITSGAAALWLAHHAPNLDAAYPLPWQRIEAFKAATKATSRAMVNQQPGAFGAGILDIRALLNWPLPSAASLVQEPPV